MSRFLGSTLCVALAFAFGCGSSKDDFKGSGGSSSLGGSSSGGRTPSQGGSSEGGVPSEGGAGNSTSSGGAVVETGGSGGEISTEGGGPSGGVPNENGGSANGGTAPTDGGTDSGGSASGGTAPTNGGAPNGGTTSGGTSNGGTANGGTASGGTSSGGTANGGSATGGAYPTSVVVSAQTNGLKLDTCGVTPATFANVPAGDYTLELTSSTLSKGSVSDDNDNTFPSVDPYVIVRVPLPAGDPNEPDRFFMLHGEGDTREISLPVAGAISLMFIDSDKDANTGQGVVTLTPTGTTASVDAFNNVIAWRTGCVSSPAALPVANRPQRIMLTASTLSSGTGFADNYVLLRLPSEQPEDDHRYAILNGVGSSLDFTPYFNGTLRAWFISSTGGGTGTATLEISDQ